MSALSGVVCLVLDFLVLQERVVYEQRLIVLLDASQVRHRHFSIELERYFLDVVNLSVATHFQLGHPKMLSLGLTSRLPLDSALPYLTQELRMAGDSFTLGNLRTKFRILLVHFSALLAHHLLLFHQLLDSLLLISCHLAPERCLHATLLGSDD